MLRLKIPAQKAMPAPPVGPILGQYGINIQNFCKDFNAITAKYKPGTILNVSIQLGKNNTYTFKKISPNLKPTLEQLPKTTEKEGYIYIYQLLKLAYPKATQHELKKKYKNMLGTLTSYTS